MNRLLVAFLGAVIISMGVGVPAAAQYDPSAGGSPTTPGGETQVAVNGCEPGESVTITIPGFSPESQTIGTDGEGNAFTVFTAPDTAGVFPGTAQCGVLNASFSIDVEGAPPPTSPSGGLPDTGSGGQGTTALVAVGVLVLGAGLFAAARVRRRKLVST